MSISDRVREHGLNLTLILAVVVAGCLIVLTAASYLRVLSTQDQADKIEAGNELAACRAIERAPVDHALAELALAQADLDGYSSDVTVAEASGDKAGELMALASMPTARQAVKDASTEVKDSVDAYTAAIELASTDPELFLRNCTN